MVRVLVTAPCLHRQILFSVLFCSNPIQSEQIPRDHHCASFHRCCCFAIRYSLVFRFVRDVVQTVGSEFRKPTSTVVVVVAVVIAVVAGGGNARGLLDDSRSDSQRGRRRSVCVRGSYYPSLRGLRYTRRRQCFCWRQWRREGFDQYSRVQQSQYKQQNSRCWYFGS